MKIMELNDQQPESPETRVAFNLRVSGLHHTYGQGDLAVRALSGKPLSEAGPHRREGFSIGSYKRCDQVDGCTGGFSIDEKIGVRGNNGGIVMQLREAGDAGICEVHRGVGIFFQHSTDCRKLIIQRLEIKRTADDHVDDASRRNLFSGSEIADLSEHGLADDSRNTKASEGNLGPCVVRVSWAQPSDKWPSIDDDSRHLPKPSMWALLVERSVCSPFPMPQRCCKHSPQERSNAITSGCAGSTMVRKPRALAGNTSAPHGRTMPFSISTSTVSKLMQRLYEKQPRKQAGFSLTAVRGSQEGNDDVRDEEVAASVISMLFSRLPHPMPRVGFVLRLRYMLTIKTPWERRMIPEERC